MYFFSFSKNIAALRRDRKYTRISAGFLQDFCKILGPFVFDKQLLKFIWHFTCKGQTWRVVIAF